MTFPRAWPPAQVFKRGPCFFEWIASVDDRFHLPFAHESREKFQIRLIHTRNEEGQPRLDEVLRDFGPNHSLDRPEKRTLLRGTDDDDDAFGLHYVRQIGEVVIANIIENDVVTIFALR